MSIIGSLYYMHTPRKGSKLACIVFAYISIKNNNLTN